MAKAINNRNNGIVWRKAASTDFAVGDFVAADGLGTIIPSTGLDQLLGVCNDSVTSTDADYATVRQINISEATYNDLFEIPVSIGVATTALEGNYVDIDPANPGSVDVSTSVAQQILVVRVLSSDLIIGKIAQCCISLS